MKAVSSLIAASSMLVSLPVQLNTGANALTLTKRWIWGKKSSDLKVSLLANDTLDSTSLSEDPATSEKRSSPRTQKDIYAFIDTIMHREENQETWKSRVNPGDNENPNFIPGIEFSLNGKKSELDMKIGFRLLPQEGDSNDARINVYYLRKSATETLYKEEGEILANDVYDIEWVQGPRVDNQLDVYAYTVIFKKIECKKITTVNTIEFEIDSQGKEIWDRIFRFWADLQQPQNDFQDWLDVNYPNDDKLGNHFYSVKGCGVEGDQKEITYFVSNKSEQIKFFIPTKDKLVLYKSTKETTYLPEKNELLAEILAKDVTSVEWIDIKNNSRYDVSFTLADGKSHQIVFQFPQWLKEEWDVIFKMWAPRLRVSTSVDKESVDPDATEEDSAVAGGASLNSVAYNPMHAKHH